MGNSSDSASLAVPFATTRRHPRQADGKRRPRQALLAKTGFFAQSALIESALDVATEDAQGALTLPIGGVWDDGGPISSCCIRFARSSGTTR